MSLANNSKSPSIFKFIHALAIELNCSEKFKAYWTIKANGTNVVIDDYFCENVVLRGRNIPVLISKINTRTNTRTNSNLTTSYIRSVPSKFKECMLPFMQLGQSNNFSMNIFMVKELVKNITNKVRFFEKWRIGK